KFVIRHRFEAPLARVEAAMFDPELPAFLRAHMKTIVAIEPLERVEENGRVRRRVKYVPAPLIESIGLKKVDPAWMAWVEESTYDRAAHRLEFRNVPVVGKVRDLIENGGTLALREAGPAATERVIEGELRVKVFLVGKIAEKVIYANAGKILEDEARALAAFLAASARPTGRA
ncbi:MAG: DUF2505 family protein, partial [Myxococcota bacterium]